jgi:hypothetical protein
VLWVLLGAIVAGCGVSESNARVTKHFDADGFGVTFDYPFTLVERALRGDGSSNESDNVVRELTLTDDDFIAVRRDPLDAAAQSSGIDALEPKVDQLAKVLDPAVGPAQPITIGGTLGLEYLDTTTDVQHRFLFFLAHGLLYLVHCRSTEQHRTEITAACDTVQRTMRAA